MVSEVRFRTLKRMAAMYFVNHFLAGTRFFQCKRGLLRAAGYEIGEGTKVVGPVHCTGQLIVGKDCWIGANLSVYGNGTVTIGDNCDIAPEVSFHTGGHVIGDASRRAGPGVICDISVGTGVWIGARSTILRQTTVGSGSVIAACSCVIHHVPENALVGGVPAKVIRELPDEVAGGSEK